MLDRERPHGIDRAQGLRHDGPAHGGRAARVGPGQRERDALDLGHPTSLAPQPSRASSSSTTEGSSLVKTGVGFGTFCPTVTGRDSQRGVAE